MPDGWLQLIRGPRPQSVKWPTKGSAPPKATAWPPTVVGSAWPSTGEVVSNARARVAKLEAAMAALGESDPTCPALLEALKKVKSQTQVRPRAYCINENFLGTCTEEDWILSRRSGPGTGGSHAGSSEVPIRGASSGRRRSSRPNQWRRGRTFLQLFQPILPTSWRSCELACKSCDGRIPICVPNCSVQGEVGERETGSRPRVYRIPLSIWSF